LRRRIVHPADLARVEQAWAALRAGKRHEIEYRIVFPDDSVRWIQERAQRVCGADGAPVRLDGIARDVTDRVGQRERLERLARIRELLGATNAAIVRLRDRGELFAEFCRIAVETRRLSRRSRARFRQLDRKAAGRGRNRRLGRAGGVVEAYNRDPQGSQSLLAEALRSGQPVVSNDLHADLKDKRREWRLPGAVRSLGYFPLFIGKRVEGALAVVAAERDVFDEAEVKLLSELAANLSLALERGQQQQRIDYLAYYDILTGLPNRRLFYERLDQALAMRDAARSRW
jgi:GAF domain-containing protein